MAQHNACCYKILGKTAFPDLDFRCRRGSSLTKNSTTPKNSPKRIRRSGALICVDGDERWRGGCEVGSRTKRLASYFDKITL